MDFTEWIDVTWTTISNFLNFLLELPSFLIGLLNIIPSDIQTIFTSALLLLTVLLVYRFIK